MNINFTAKHTKIMPEWKSYSEKRLKAIEKILKYETEADLIFSIEKYRHLVEINIKTKIGTLNSTEETDEMHSSLVAAFDHIERRIKKERGKLRERKRRRSREPETFAQLPSESPPGPKLIRSRDYSLKPMSIEEAVIQFQSEKKEVFVFRKSETERWAVLYRRKDGNFGLVEPE